MFGRKTLVAIAAGLIGVGSGAAYAASPPSTGPRGFLHDVAVRLGISDDTLAEALRAAAIARVDRALADGKLTQAQADAFKERINSGRGPLFLPGPRPGGVFGARRGPGFVPGASDYLGLTPAQLLAALRSGKTLAQLAQSTPGKTVDGLKRAIKDSIKANLDAHGVLSDAQKQAILSRIDALLDAIVNGARHP
jgi:hypothetical protein